MSDVRSQTEEMTRCMQRIVAGIFERPKMKLKQAIYR